MNTNEAFLQSIIENPDDDTPRLIFADWLEEQGRGLRAEFIRFQRERARLPPDHLRGAELLHREQQLSPGNLKQWKQDLPDWPGVTWSFFERGFPRYRNQMG